MTGNIGFASSSKSFAWSNTGVNADGDKTYHIALADGSGDTMDAIWFSSNGTMICGVLPEGSYLIKEM